MVFPSLIGVTADSRQLFTGAVLLACAAIGIYFCYTAFGRLPTVYHILRNDPLSVGELHGHRGPVEIEGQAVESDAGTVESPFTGTHCLAYSYEVEERQRYDDDGWQTLVEGRAGVEFVVDDGTGRVVVDPTGADIHFDSHQQTAPSGTEPPERIRDFLDANDIGEHLHDRYEVEVSEWVSSKEDNRKFKRKQRFTERRLHAGDNVYVYGQATSGRSVSWGSSLVDAMVGDGDDTPVFVISDTDERRTAWRIARSGLRKAALGLVVVLWFGLFIVLLL